MPVPSLRNLYLPFLQQRPDAPMLVDGAQTVSYAGFDQSVSRTAAWLAAQGIGPGDRVGVWLVNRLEWLYLLFAAEQLGATIVAINTRYRSSELQYILERSSARLLIMQAHFNRIDFSDVLAGVDQARLPALNRVALVDGENQRDLPARILGRPTVRFALPGEGLASHADAVDHEVILFTTSGTTKGPKLVRHTPATLSTHVKAVATEYGLAEPEARLLAALPLCGVFGLDSALGAIAGGAPVVLMELFDGEQAANLLAQHRITHCFGSDEMFRRISEVAQGPRPFPHARVFGFASFGSSAQELAASLEERGFPLLGLYGSSEVQALFSLQKLSLPLEERVKGGGYPALGARVAVRARNPGTGEICPHGTSGEIEIQSPASFIGYLDNEEATRAAFTDDGFFRTGDLGYTRGDGSFVYQTRMGDTLRLGGFLVDPTEIESALTEEPGIQGAQVIGIELDRQPRVAAFVIADETTDLQAVAQALRGRLASFKVPARIWPVREFPNTASANGTKVQRVRLRQMAQELLALEQGTA